MRKDQEPASINTYLCQKRHVAEAEAARDILTEQNDALDAPIQEDVSGVDVAFRAVERIAFAALTAMVRVQVLPASRAIFWPFGPASGLRGSPRRDGAWPTSPILCVSIFFCFMMPPSRARTLPGFLRANLFPGNYRIHPCERFYCCIQRRVS